MMQTRRYQSFSMGCLALAVLALAGPGRADESPVAKSGLELRTFRPALDSKGHVTVNGATVLPHLGFSVGLVLDFSQDIHYAVEADKATDDHTIVKNYLNGVFSANLGLWNWIVVGLQVPVTLVNGTVYRFNTDNEKRNWSSQGFGDLSVHVKSRIWYDVENRWGISAYVRSQFGTGKEQFFFGDPGIAALTAGAIFEERPVKWLRMDLDLGFRYPFGYKDLYARTADNPDAPLVLKEGSQATFGLGSSFELVENTMELMLEYIGFSSLNDSAFSAAYTPMEAVGGFKVFVEENSYLLAGACYGIPTDGFSTPLYRVFLGFIYEPSIGDRDHDGIPDDKDACPDEPEDKDGFQDTDGCPDPDNDLDGILDVDDRCPMAPEDKDGFQDDDGCPDPDNDNDGVLDVDDKCPNVPGPKENFGCPDKDTDKDGIPDRIDKCPLEPEDKDGFEDDDGCPDIDNDQDRILDVDDKCPNEPEVYNGVMDEDGCPDNKGAAVLENSLIIFDKINFEYDSAEIKSESFPILDSIVELMKANAFLKLVEVQGHADERGSDRYNLKLTGKRAESVVKYLTDHGVEKARLRWAGYGELCPIDSGHDEAAWEKNRRVEFKVVKTDAGPTGVEIACPAAKHLIPVDK